MKSNKIKLLILLSFITISCNKNITRISKSNDTDIKKNSDYYGYYYALTKATNDRIMGNYAQAIQSLNLCIQYNKQSDASYYQLSIIYYNLGKVDVAIDYAKKAINIDPKNIWYQYNLAGIYNKQKDIKGLISIYNQILQYHPDKINIYFDLVNFYVNINDTENALKILNKLEDRIGLNENIVLAKEQIFSSQGKYNEAIDIMNIFIKNNDYNVKDLGILAELYLIVNKEKEAFQQFDKIFKIDKNNGIAKLSIASYYIQKNNYDSAFVYYNQVFQNNDISLDIKIKEIVKFITNPYELSLYDTFIVKLLNILDSNYYDNLKVRTLKSDYYVRKSDYINAQKELNYVVEKNKKNYPVWEQLLIVEQKNKDYISLSNHSKEAINYFNKEPILYYFNGIANSQLNNDSLALISYLNGLDLVKDNLPLTNQFYINIADIYYKISKYKESDNYFEKSLLIDKNNTLVLNNYSYYLSLREEKLDYAELLCKRLISIENNNYAYFDTYSWVLFKENKYKEALKFIKKAYLFGGQNDNVILDHYGDILMKNNMKEKAIKYWKSSLVIMNSSEILNKIKDAQK